MKVVTSLKLLAMRMEMMHGDIIESVGNNNDSDSGDGGPDANDLLMPKAN